MRRVAQSMAEPAREAGARIVNGDGQVVASHSPFPKVAGTCRLRVSRSRAGGARFDRFRHAAGAHFAEARHHSIGLHNA
jgi:hypothetical protein